jgi:CRISPR-associated protein Csx10
MLKEATGIEATLLRSFTMTKNVGGWNVSWSLPKPTNLAVMMGSLYVFQSKYKLEDKHFDQLEFLERNGIGERRTEGYGQVRVCDEFHVREEN